jgi:hypothetical protein
VKTSNLTFLSVYLMLPAALGYKQEGRGFETRLSEPFLSVYLILPAALGPGVYRNQYQRQKQAPRHL